MPWRVLFLAPGGPDMTLAAVDPESGLATAVLLLEMILLEHGFTQHTVISPDPPGDPDTCGEKMNTP